MTGPERGPVYVRIAIATALMASVVFIAGRSLREANEPAALPLTGETDTPSIPTETGVFRLSRMALEYKDAPPTPAAGRSLETFYRRRAYPGAPPFVPHALADPTSFGGRTCLACHGGGGWVEKFGAYAPVTPHPELLNCVQCHVATSEAPLFRGTAFQPASRPAIRRAALPNSPPPVPHPLEMRDNCLSCHGGPGAVREIRVSHPERVNCRQCHALGTDATAAFSRPPKLP
jgi:cytochrome c-type protein NapB